jgi:capsular polysaccharide biosynthesis protein
MDLFTIAATLWRHKLVTIPIIVITLIGAAYIIIVKPPTYTSNAEVLLVNPPPPPTTAQIAADPKLGKVNTNNPYLAYGTLVQVADIVIDVANSPTAGQALQGDGVSSKFTVALENSFQNPPVIQVSGTGTSSAMAVNTATLVTAEVIEALRQIQVAQKVNPAYMITSEEFVKPTVATTSSSSKLRTLIGFAAGGLILMLIAVSIAQSLEKRRKPRKAAPARSKSKGGRDHEPPAGNPDLSDDQWRHADSPSGRAEQQMPDNRPSNRGYRGHEEAVRGQEMRRPEDPDPRGPASASQVRHGRW